jgi:hypothetical protein
MTKREAMDITAAQNRLLNVGISTEDAETLRRISMTLRRWFELECGTDHGCVDRDETTNKPYWLMSDGHRRYPMADRETGARKRLAAIMARYPTLTPYVQGDPRGCALYILTPEHLDANYSIDSIYNRGIAVF